MKARHAILFALSIGFIATGSVLAAQPAAIDASSVTQLPTEGTPDVLLRKVRVFATEITQVNSAADAKHAQLRRQLVTGLETAITKAQSEGDIDTILALKKAMENLDGLTDSDIPVVKNALLFRGRKSAEIEQSRKAAALNAARAFNDRLEATKKDETKRGNFETAKAIGEYQKKLQAWARNLPRTVGSKRIPATKQETVPPSPKPPERTSAETVPRPAPARQSSLPRTASVEIDSRSLAGTSIGMAESGDEFRFRYRGGTWECNGISESPDARKLDHEEHRCVVVRKERPGEVVAVLPADTASRPFAFVVQDSGEYCLRANDRYIDWCFGDNTGSVRYQVETIPRGRRQNAAQSAGRTSVANSPSGLSESKESASEPPRTLVVPGNAWRGVSIGSASRGERFVFQYQGGTWTCYTGHRAPESPDEKNLRYDEHQIVIADAKAPVRIIAALPPETRTRPFEFVVPEDGEFVLRMNDGGTLDIQRNDSGNFQDNSGEVRYSVKRKGGTPIRSVASQSAAMPPQRSETAPAPSILSGTQKAPSVRLTRAGSPYTVREQYIVPAEGTLRVEEGVTILFEAGASLNAEGSLIMAGSENAPIVCKGSGSGLENWNGILLNSESAEYILECVQVCGAKRGVLAKGGCIFNQCVFVKNAIGVGFHGKPSKAFDCLFTQNSEKGAEAGGPTQVTFDHCSFVDNRGEGIGGRSWGVLYFDRCEIARNAGGGFAIHDWNSKPNCKRCIIEKNGGFDADSSGGNTPWNFSENWWGAETTRILQQKGDGTNLPNINDGRDSGTPNVVALSDYLLAPPSDCGSTVRLSPSVR